jgi:hypothetical protein
MKNILFINDSFPKNLEEICEYENFRPSPTEVYDPDFTFNQFADRKLSEVFENKKYDLIILPYNLYQGNYSAFQGITIALHIRLTLKWNHHKVPILFIGSEPINQLLKLAPNPYIFSTSGIFTTQKRSKENIKKQVEWIFENKSTISDEEYQAFLSKINLTPPEFYDNRHSITNEWALIQLDYVSGHNVLKNHPKLQEIKSNLYIKWQLAQTNKENFKKTKQKKQAFRISNASNKRVLLIDDEWEKGWFSLYKAFLGESCHFDYLEINKGDNNDIILEKLDKKINEGWDLFLLDIRLTDNDHKSHQFKNYAGFKVLERIKSKNKGNQVILTSASNKQLIYDYGQRILGADGIIIKHDFISKLNAINLEESYSSVIQECFDNLYKKEIFDSQTKIIFNLNKLRKGKKLQKEFVKNIESSLNLAFNALLIRHEESITISFLNYFQILEYLAIEFISPHKIRTSSNQDEYYWELRDGAKKLHKIYAGNPRNPTSLFVTKGKSFVPTPVKLFNILRFICNETNRELFMDLEKLFSQRNAYIHPDLDKTASKFEKNDIIFEFKIIKSFLNKIIASF